MATLKNPRHEAFAQARARGALLDDAFEIAGFVVVRGHSSRLARRLEVAERVAELRAYQASVEDSSPLAMIVALLNIAKAGSTSLNPAVVKEARLALLDAARLAGDLALAHRVDRVKITHAVE